MEENIGEKKTNKTGLIILIVVIVLAVGCGAFFLGKYFGDKKPAEPPKEQEPKKENEATPEPSKPEEPSVKLDDVTLISINVKNLGSKKTYEVQLAKKVSDNYEDPDDKYIYAFYDKTNGKLLTEFKYGNQSCGNSCKGKDADEGCVEVGTKAYSFSNNNKDYLYITRTTNECEGYSSQYIIYDIEQSKIVIDDYGASDVLENTADGLITRYVSAGDSMCAWKAEMYCYTGYGLIIFNNNSIKKLGGISVTEKDNYYYIIDYDEEKFNLTVYNKKGETIKRIDNLVSYNDKYLVVGENGKLIAMDYESNKIGEFNSITFDRTKYIYNPDLTTNGNKLVLEYILKDDTGDVQKAYFNLK